eukprot:g62511.t1
MLDCLFLLARTRPGYPVAVRSQPKAQSGRSLNCSSLQDSRQMGKLWPYQTGPRPEGHCSRCGSQAPEADTAGPCGNLCLECEKTMWAHLMGVEKIYRRVAPKSITNWIVTGINETRICKLATATETLKTLRLIMALLVKIDITVTVHGHQDQSHLSTGRLAATCSEAAEVLQFRGLRGSTPHPPMPATNAWDTPAMNSGVRTRKRREDCKCGQDGGNLETNQLDIPEASGVQEQYQTATN